jgi:hypothetical protein
MKVDREPEVLVYLARHYSYAGESDEAIGTLGRAMRSGFVCAPSTLRSDPWLEAVRRNGDFGPLLAEAERAVDANRRIEPCPVWRG